MSFSLVVRTKSGLHSPHAPAPRHPQYSSRTFSSRVRFSGRFRFFCGKIRHRADLHARRGSEKDDRIIFREKNTNTTKDWRDTLNGVSRQFYSPLTV